MRAALAALAAAGSILVLAGCADVQNGASEAASSAASIGAGVRSSAASIGAGVRSACQASDGSMATLDELAGTLADNADQRQALLPQVRQTVDTLAAQVDDRSELQPVVSAGRGLVDAMSDSSEATVELAARQTQVAVRSGQALCKLAK
jgi:ABC-type transporter Mla subunit MlaD